MALTSEQKYQVAIEKTTDKEQSYMSNPTKKNYTWIIVLVTIAIIAGTGYYFYKH